MKNCIFWNNAGQEGKEILNDTDAMPVVILRGAVRLHRRDLHFYRKPESRTLKDNGGYTKPTPCSGKFGHRQGTSAGAPSRTEGVPPARDRPMTSAPTSSPRPRTAAGAPHCPRRNGGGSAVGALLLLFGNRERRQKEKGNAMMKKLSCLVLGVIVLAAAVGGRPSSAQTPVSADEIGSSCLPAG